MSRRKLFTSSCYSPDLDSFEKSFEACNSSPCSTIFKSDQKANKSNNIPTITNKTPRKDEPDTIAQDPDCNCNDSDSDSVSMTDFYTSFNPKSFYTKEEDEFILKFVLQGQNIFKVTSVLMWKLLESKKQNPKRTYQSLKNRFLRNIKPRLFTTYGHLIKDKAMMEKILVKFPELKNTVGRRETLSGIKLPERRSSTTMTKKEFASSASGNKDEGNLKKNSHRVSDPDFISCSNNEAQPVPSNQPEWVTGPAPVDPPGRVLTLNPVIRLERIKLPEENDQSEHIARPERIARPKPVVGFEDREPQEADRPERVGRPQPVAQLEPRSYSDFFNIPNYERTVKVSSDGVNVLVNFTSKHPEISFSSPFKPLGIYQKFERLKRNNQLILCPTCGNYNNPKETTPSKSDNQSDDLIYNSVETPKTASKNSKKSNFDAEPKSSISPKRLRSQLPAPDYVSCSPSLLSDNSAANKGGDPTPDLVEKRSEARSLRRSRASNSLSSKKYTHVRSKRSQTRNLASSLKKPSKIKNKKKRALVDSASGSTSRSRNMGKPPRKNTRDSFEASNPVYSNKKIICTDEEAVLLRKYLKKQFGSISSEADLTAFLLESSPDAETPELTLDFETASQNDKKEIESPSTSSSSLFQNMKKMLAETIESNGVQS